jgi:hypothetical protein
MDFIPDVLIAHALSYLDKDSLAKNIFVCKSFRDEIYELPMVKWLRVQNCPWNEWTCYIAARAGCLNILMLLHANGCYWNTWSCEVAARRGRHDILQWLRENECPWDGYTCRSAAKRGHIELLQWARANGCPEEN